MNPKFIELTPVDGICTALWIAIAKIESVAVVENKTAVFATGRTGHEKYTVTQSPQEVLARIENA